MYKALKGYLFVLIVFVAFSAGCGGTAELPPTETPLPTQVPTLAPTPETNLYPDFELITPENIHRLEEVAQLGTGFIYDVAVSPDESLIAVYTASGIYLYDSATLTEQGFIELTYWTTNRSVTFTPDGEYLVYSLSSSVTFWNISSSEEDFSFMSNIPGFSISGVKISPDSERVVLTSTPDFHLCMDSDGGNFALYDLDGNLLFNRNYCDFYSENFYSFSDDGLLYIVFSSKMNTVFPEVVYVIDISNGFLLASYEAKLIGYEGDFETIIEGNENLLPTEHELLVIKEEFYAVEKEIESESSCFNSEHWNDVSLAFEYDQLVFDQELEQVVIKVVNRVGKLVRLELWDVSTCRINQRVTFSSTGLLHSPSDYFIRSPIFNASSDLLASINDMDVYVWDMSSKELLFSVQGDARGNPVTRFSFNSDGTRLVSGKGEISYLADDSSNKDYEISIWDAFTGELLLEVAPPGKVLEEIAMTPDSDVILVHDSEGLNFWNISTGDLLSTLLLGTYVFDHVRDGVWISAQDDLSRISLFDYHTGEALIEMKYFAGKRPDLIINKDCTRLAVSYQWAPEIFIIDILSEDILHKILVNSTDHFIAVVNNYFAYQAHEVSQRQVYFQLFNFEQVREQLRIPGELLAFNSEMIISEMDEDYLIWETLTGKFLWEHYSYIGSDNVAISPNGYFIAITGEDGIIRVLGVPEK